MIEGGDRKMKSPNGITQVIEGGGSKNGISKWYHSCDRRWVHFRDRFHQKLRSLRLDFVTIDVNTMEKSEPRTVGAEHLLLQDGRSASTSKEAQ